MLDYFWEMTSWLRPCIWQSLVCLSCPWCLARQWIHFYVSIEWLLGEMLLENVDVWSCGGYMLRRQFTRLLVWWYFYVPLYLAVDCSTLPVLEEYIMWIILGDDFRMDAVFSFLLGSSVDMLLAVYGRRGYCLRKQRNAWFSVVHAMRQSRSMRISTFLRGNRLRILRSIHVATADSPQLQLIFKVVDILFVLQRLILWSILFRLPLWIARGQGGRCPLEVVDILVTPRQIKWSRLFSTSWRFTSFLVGKVIDVPVVQVERLPHVPSWRRQPCSGVFTASKVMVGPVHRHRARVYTRH